mgnify:CR=1 FL=1
MNRPTTILIADDDADLRDILRSVLEPAGFAVVEAADGEAAQQAIRRRTPDLVILDYMMPGLTGPQVCQWLKQDTLLRHTPVIMLTGKSEVQDKVHGITAGADDYVLKPFEPRELLARVQMVLRRTAQDLDANPLTRLPGNISIGKELETRLASGGPIAVCYADLDRFKAFNDHYGFLRGDEIIKRTAEILLNAVRSHGNPGDFVGHIGGDDFVVVTTPDRAEAVCEAVVKAFDAMIPTLYDEQAVRQGCLIHTDRRGQQVSIPFLSISIALVTNEERPLAHPGQIAEIGAELKTHAKQFDRSLYVKERRKSP